MDDVWGDLLGPPKETTPAAVIADYRLKPRLAVNILMRKKLNHTAAVSASYLFIRNMERCK